MPVAEWVREVAPLAGIGHLGVGEKRRLEFPPDVFRSRAAGKCDQATAVLDWAAHSRRAGWSPRSMKSFDSAPSGYWSPFPACSAPPARLAQLSAWVRAGRWNVGCSRSACAATLFAVEGGKLQAAHDAGRGRDSEKIAHRHAHN